MIPKEIFAILFCVFYLVYIAFSNWGKRYKFVGIEPYVYKRFVNEPKSKEEKCRIIFERLFNVSFQKCRPDFLKNPLTSKNLELDGFAPNIPTSIGKGIAFEFNGSQHYFYTPKYHRSVEDFEDQLYRDKLKKELCEKAKVTLITIPYNVEDLETFIVNKIHTLGLYYYIN